MYKQIKEEENINNNNKEENSRDRKEVVASECKKLQKRFPFNTFRN